MTREQSLAWIEALDRYLDAKRDRERVRLNHGALAATGECKVTEERAREALIEAMAPVATANDVSAVVADHVERVVTGTER